MTPEDMRKRDHGLMRSEQFAWRLASEICERWDATNALLERLVESAGTEDWEEYDPLCEHCGTNLRMHCPPWKHCPPPGVSPGTLFKEASDGSTQDQQPQPTEEEKEEGDQEERQEGEVAICRNCGQSDTSHVLACMQALVGYGHTFEVAAEEIPAASDEPVCENCGQVKGVHSDAFEFCPRDARIAKDQWKEKT